MGLFDFFKKKAMNETNSNESVNDLQKIDSVAEVLKRVKLENGIETIKLIADNWTSIESTKLNYASIEATAVEYMKIDQSKFGHYPKIPNGFDYPKDSAGNYMYPLAQINFKEMPILPGFPTSGFLQIYINAYDDCFGLQFEESNQVQKGFRVLFFEEDEVKNHCTDFSFLQEVMATENTPIFKPHSLVFKIEEEYLGRGDVRFEKNGKKVMQELQKNYPQFEDEIDDAFYEDFPNGGHKIGGYAFFTQEDPRNYDEELSEYVLLLQIDTDDEIMWGDSGVGNFFIHSEDLLKKDFSKVLYNWDCC
jgi:uncharacterized protein YwqG